MATKVKPKVYHLLEHTNSTAPHYQRVNKDQRVRFEKRPVDHLYLKQTFIDPQTGKNRTARLKLNCDTIWQDEQIKLGILANEPFTRAEKDAVKFVQGTAIVTKEIVQTFFDSVPQNEKNFAESQSADIKQPLFREYDKTVKLKSENDEFMQRLSAANKIAKFEEGDEQKAKEFLYRLNGSFFKIDADADILELRTMMISYLDDADEAMLAKMLSDEENQDEQMAILVGKLVASKVLSFNDVTNHVALKKGEGWHNVKMISSELPAGERMRLFVEFLSTKEGALLKADLQKLAGAKEPEAKAKKKKEEELTT